MKDFINKYILNEVTSVIVDHLLLVTVAFTAIQGDINYAIAGLAIYFIGQHPRYLGRK